MMPKTDTIEAIMKLNPTADSTFLSRFSGMELDQYLLRLRALPVSQVEAAAVRQVDPRDVAVGEALSTRRVP